SGISSVGGNSAGGQTAISVETIERVRRTAAVAAAARPELEPQALMRNRPAPPRNGHAADRAEGVRQAFELQLNRLKSELDEERRKRQECETQLRSKQQEAFKKDQELTGLRAACERKDQTIRQLEDSTEKLNENWRRRDAEREQSARRLARVREELRREAEARASLAAELEAARAEKRNTEASARQRERVLEAEARGWSERQAEWQARQAETERARHAEREELERWWRI
uniref:DUF3584 domain-containing protein n=1 Tax=Macrostomum lignano TaxID=282301 RepID=A0A1I8FQX7_9PLAT